MKSCTQVWKNRTLIVKKFLIERNLCCLNINEGGMGMINKDNFVKGKQIKFIYKIINGELIIFFVNAPILKV
jgi:hypothetical protein